MSGVTLVCVCSVAGTSKGSLLLQDARLLRLVVEDQQGGMWCLRESVAVKDDSVCVELLPPQGGCSHGVPREQAIFNHNYWEKGQSVPVRVVKAK